MSRRTPKPEGWPPYPWRRTPWAFVASNLYHNEFWLRFIGRKRVADALKTPWGQLFKNY